MAMMTGAVMDEVDEICHCGHKFLDSSFSVFVSFYLSFPGVSGLWLRKQPGLQLMVQCVIK